ETCIQRTEAPVRACSERDVTSANSASSHGLHQQCEAGSGFFISVISGAPITTAHRGGKTSEKCQRMDIYH
ncbi:mCG1032401, partial [Mus musculus]